MDLNLEEKLTPEEIVELRKRVFSFADQMFSEGLSVGRELKKEEIFDSTEQFVRDKLSAMTSYFTNDKMWKIMPPMGYNDNPNVDIPQPSIEMDEKMVGDINMAKNPLSVVSQQMNDVEDMEPQDGYDTDSDDDVDCCPGVENLNLPPENVEKPDWVIQMEKDGKPPFPS